MESDGTFNNDFFTVSSRLYTRISELSDEHFEIVADLRDKNDFFEKLDAEKLALTGQNTLQAHQLSIRHNVPNSRWIATLGRFPVEDAGAVYVDGADAGFRWSSSLRTSFFGGEDPRLPYQTYLQHNSGAYAFGTYTVFQPPAPSWQTSFVATAALVGKDVSNHLDRFYFYNYFLYEWSSPSRLMGMMYLDFRPRTYVQTGLLSFNQAIGKFWQATIQGSAIDPIEYVRRTGVLETLPASPYHEGSLNLRQRVNDKAAIIYNFLAGERDIDHKHLDEASLGMDFSQIFGKEFSSSFRLGYRNNFTSKDTFTKISLGYYPKDWELVLDESYAIQRDVVNLHPLISELSAAHFFSREFYGQLMIEDAFSEIAKIKSASIYFGYRFGSKDIPPLRDGAPPRGRL